MEKCFDIVTGVCPKIVKYDIEDGKIFNLEFDRGCQGNGKFISKLVEGREINEIIDLAKGIQCGNKGTSCGDQLAKSLEKRL